MDITKRNHFREQVRLQDGLAVATSSVATATELINSSGVILNEFEVSCVLATPAAIVFYVANDPVEVVGVKLRYATAESTAATLTATVERLQGTEALGSGDALLSAAINVKATAATTYTGTVVSSGTQILEAGNALGLKLSASPTELAGLCVTVQLKRVS